MKYKGIIFDFNGTLFFDTPFHNLAWQEMTQELIGRDLDEELKVKMHGKNNQEIIRCIDPKLDKCESEFYSKRKEALYRQICLAHPADLHLVKGASELFDYLQRNNIPFTIASASIKDNIEFFIKTFSLDKWFAVDKIVYDDGSYPNKISMFQKASELIGVPLESCVIFEDSKTGIGYAKEIGTGLVVGIGDKHIFKVLNDYGADMCISDFDEFDCHRLIQ